VTKKIVAVATTLALATVMSFAISIPKAHAAGKVDCDKVMEELNAGKKPKEVASDLGISTSSVRRCKRKAHKASMASPAAMSSPAAPMAPMAAPSPGK
jgi:hypothetical protein